jgi:hypothetical protein
VRLKLGLNPLFMFSVLVLIAGLSAAAAPAAAQMQPANTRAVSVVVTVLGKGKQAPPEIPQDSVSVRQDRDVRRVLAWRALPQDGAGLDFIVYVDDSLHYGVDQQLQQVAGFIRSLPPKAKAEVVYSTGGETQLLQPLTTDHDLAAKAVRIPAGTSSTSTGLYAGLQDFAKHWSYSDNRRVLLIISNGIDLLRGVEDSYPGINPDLQWAIDELHRQDFSVYTIYAGGGGRMLQNEFLVSNGQGCLARLAAETGGEAFFFDFSSPLDFQPYLDEISNGINHQYLLTFAVVTSAKPHLSTLHVGVEVEGADVLAPDHVYVPAALATAP